MRTRRDKRYVPCVAWKSARNVNSIIIAIVARRCFNRAMQIIVVCTQRSVRISHGDRSAAKTIETQIEAHTRWTFGRPIERRETFLINDRTCVRFFQAAVISILGEKILVSLLVLPKIFYNKSCIYPLTRTRARVSSTSSLLFCSEGTVRCVVASFPSPFSSILALARNLSRVGKGRVS